MNAPAAAPVAGAFAFKVGYNPGNPSRFPFAIMVAGAGALVGGEGGVAIGRFGFAHADGRVTNAQADAATDRIGVAVLPFLQPALNTWLRNYWDEDTRTYRSREGLEVSLLTRGAVWVKFEGGAWGGQQVYASTIDGQPYSGYADDAVPTPWKVQTPCGPGELAIITTLAFFS